jgi:hypothetical protein
MGVKCQDEWIDGRVEGTASWDFYSILYKVEVGTVAVCLSRLVPAPPSPPALATAGRNHQGTVLTAQ